MKETKQLRLSKWSRCLLLFVCSMVVISSAWSQSVVRPQLRNDKPSIYLSVIGESKEYYTCSTSWLPSVTVLLVNNSPRPINVLARVSNQITFDAITLSDGTKARAFKDRTRVELCFNVDSVDRSVSIPHVGCNTGPAIGNALVPSVPTTCGCDWMREQAIRDTYNGIWVGPGTSILFDVPKQYTTPGLRLRTQFSFEWEFRGGKLGHDEPSHFVSLVSLN